MHGGHHAGHHGGDGRWLSAALALICAFMIGEVVVGLLSGSLALLSDAAHMVTDAAAIGLALLAARMAARPPSGGFTFGLRRAEMEMLHAGKAASPRKITSGLRKSKS